MKKNTIAILLFLGSLMCGCANAVESEMPRESETAVSMETQAESTTRLETEATESESVAQIETEKIPSENASAVKVTQGGPYGEISIDLPDGWRYEVCPVDSDKLVNGLYGIHFYPNSVAGGFVELVYVDRFGVCGTGLETEDVTLAGNPAHIGTYDNHEYWDYITFEGTAQGLVALTCSVDDWWDKYEEAVLDILDTLSYNPDRKEGGVYVYTEDSEIEDLALHFYLKDISPSGATMVFDQYDAELVKGELEFGDAFLLEQQKDNRWKEVPIITEGEYGFNDIANIIIPGEKREEELPWEWLYGTLAPGEYRIKKSIRDFARMGEDREYTVYAHFILN